jgi:hypothetical protein
MDSFAEKRLREVEGWLRAKEYGRMSAELQEMNGQRCAAKQTRSLQVYQFPQRKQHGDKSKLNSTR